LLGTVKTRGRPVSMGVVESAQITAPAAGGGGRPVTQRFEP
jgi:hypothetical protein